MKKAKQSDKRGLLVIRTIESFYPYMSGSANDAFMVSSLLKKKGIYSPIYTSDYAAKNEPSFEIYKGVEVNRFKSTLSFMRYCVTPSLAKKLNSENFDIIHSNNYRNYQADIAFKIAKSKNKPFVISVHGALLGYENFVHGIRKLPYISYDIFTSKRTVLQADKVIVCSNIEIEEAIRFGVSEDKIEKIPMAINVSDYYTKRRDKENITALFVGRISRNRNLEPVIRAMKSVDKSVKLRIVGEEVKSSSTAKSGYLDELKVLVKQLGLNNVEFAGAKYGKELINEYKQADLFVYTSLSENFGQTILEAAASGLPVICTPVGVANEIVNKNTGYIVDFQDDEKIADAINAFTYFNKRKQFGTNIHELVRKYFNKEKIVNNYIKIYNDLIL